MFSLVNLILTIIILLRVYKYDKFFIVSYDMPIKEQKKEEYYKKQNRK